MFSRAHATPENALDDRRRPRRPDLCLRSHRSHADLASLDDTRALVDPTLPADARLVGLEEAEERRGRLTRALATLSTRERAVAEARHLREIPVEEAVLATQLGLSPSVVRRLETRALGRLLQQSQPEECRGDLLLGGRRITRPRPSAPSALPQPRTDRVRLALDQEEKRRTS